MVAEHAMPLWNTRQQEMVPVVTHRCWPSDTKHSAREKNRLTLQLVSYWPRQVWANSTVLMARWVAPWLLFSGKVWEKGTP